MTRRVLFVLLIGVFMAVAAVACSPDGGQEIPLSGANDTASDTASEAANDTAGDTASEAAGDLSVAAEVGATGTPGALATVPDVQIVDATPMSDAELAAQPTSQVEGGAAADEAGQTEPGGLDGLPPVADWPTYADSAYGFSMMVPPDFIVRAADAARLTGLMPAPSAAVYFMNPTTADSALAGTDAPDLEVRIFESGPIGALGDWLTAAGSVADQTTTPYQLGGLSGVQICATTMVFPQCSIFVAGNDRVYQLRALNLEGETMAQSFTLTP